MRIMNYMRDPLPTSTNNWRVMAPAGSVEIRMTSAGDALYVKALTDAEDKSVEQKYELGMTLEAGSYVFASYVTCQEQGLPVLRVICAEPFKEIARVNYTRGEGTYVVPFTLTQTQTVRARVMCPQTQGLTANYKHFIVCSADDWQKVQALYRAGDLKEEFFYSDTLPLG